ncbi:acyltransferase family protein [Taibaiella koreensis]|uniref:acyltransferase family protein n=1 Tax=Taibaiella koreensis TaxID=1268548 RepID=UPI000E59B8F5|nr:acyltransferase [Taibaiella koreensis]
MNPLSPLFAIGIFLIALATAYFINLKYTITDSYPSRNENIDGLRGFLALGVFIHHSSIWYQYVRLKSWESVPSNFYMHLGETSVAFFFMITAFLFVTKLLQAREQKINWHTLFISRIFRLTPMYLVSILILVLIVMQLSDWQLKETVRRFFSEAFLWGTFTIAGGPLINQSTYTHIINAGVVWSLPYEWLFYFSLPVLALFISRKSTSLFYIVGSILFLAVFFTFKHFLWHHLVSFAGGAIAPFLIKYGSRKVNYKSPLFSIIIIACLLSVPFFETSANPVCKLLIIVIFNLIALGNNVFGILKSRALRFLGDISYSTYLIHGIILFLVLYYIFGLEAAAALSPTQFCITICCITPILVLICFLFYIGVEKPFMDYAKRIRIGKKK